MIPEFPQTSRPARKIFSSFWPRPHQTERKIPAERILYEDLFPDFHRCQKAEIICTRTVPADIKRYNSFRWSFRPVVIVIIGVIRIATNGSGRWPARSVRADNARDRQLLQSRRRGWTLDAPFCRSVCVRKRPEVTQWSGTWPRSHRHHHSRRPHQDDKESWSRDVFAVGHYPNLLFDLPDLRNMFSKFWSSNALEGME